MLFTGHTQSTYERQAGYGRQRHKVEGEKRVVFNRKGDYRFENWWKNRDEVRTDGGPHYLVQEL
jgi:hypothetical protein